MFIHAGYAPGMTVMTFDIAYHSLGVDCHLTRGEQGNSSLSNTSMRRITSRRAQNLASNSSFNLASGSRMVNGWILGFVSTRERDSHDASSFAADLPYVTLKTDREVQTT